jgi:hypothetical protein
VTEVLPLRKTWKKFAESTFPPQLIGLLSRPRLNFVDPIDDARSCACLAESALPFKARRNADRRKWLVSKRGRHLIAFCVAYPAATLWSPAYLESHLPSPLPTKDGGTLYAVKDVRAYVLSLAHSRSEHL